MIYSPDPDDGSSLLRSLRRAQEALDAEAERVYQADPAIPTIRCELCTDRVAVCDVEWLTRDGRELPYCHGCARDLRRWERASGGTDRTV